ncbi:MAG: hypothetical protein HFF06_08345 [Oscillospiraceae bacterium]|jgi:hypothetical protein|nr:hypothetical protein [Oscillospiraceae bacterium]
MEENTREIYAYLDRLSTRRLEEMLLADLEDDSGRDTSQVIFHILEVLRQRETTPLPSPDTDRAWEEFQQFYNTPEGRGQALYPCREDHAPTPLPAPKCSLLRLPVLWKTLRIVAATMALLLALMMGAQASGLNVFGTLAYWTDEILHWGSEQTGIQSKNYQQFLNLLTENDIQKKHAPSWYPSEAIAGNPTVQYSDSAVSIKISFSIADSGSFHINVVRHTSPSELESGFFEKDYDSVEQYLSHGRTFYIFSNVNSVMATWTDGNLSESIWGGLSLDDIKTMIDSLGGF